MFLLKDKSTTTAMYLRVFNLFLEGITMFIYIIFLIIKRIYTNIHYVNTPIKLKSQKN